MPNASPSSEQPVVPATGQAAQKPSPKPVRPKVGRAALACLGYALLFIIAFAVLVAVLIAKTGIVTIPLASRLYHGPQPTRAVTAETVDAKKFYDSLSRQLTAEVRAGKKPPYRVTLGEAELTGALRGAIENALDGAGVTAELPQIAVTPDYMEFSGRFIKSGLRFDTLARFRPQVRDGEVTFDLARVELGDFAIPTSTARSLTGLLAGRDLGAWRLEIGQAGLTEIRLLDGKVELLMTSK